ncbi:MAG: sugar transferase [Bacteroidota bacterium]
MTTFISKIAALVCLVLLSPILFLFGLLIYFKSPGPLFYSQKRVGKDGVLFQLYKLRTMATNSQEILNEIIAADPEMAREWKAYGCFQKDPRIAGHMAKYARQFSVDELPQLVNIVRGDMHFVGPRPLEVEFNEQLNSEDRALRLSVKPGLTGLWQVGPRSYSNHRQMMKYDRLYVENQSPKLDFYILLKTIGVIFKRTGF